jgi:hypothetical protein
MNYSLKYRKSIVEAKRAWDKIKSNDGEKTVINKKSDIAKSVIERQNDLKIYGGGIAILSKADGKPILLYSPEVQKHFGIKDDVAEYEYLHTPYQFDWVDKGFKNFIDLLFFVSRDTKYPEYVKKIQDTKKQNAFEYPFQFKLRDEYEILHCSSGEVLFFTLLWRLIVELAIKNNNLNIKYDKSLFNAEKCSQNWFSVFLKSKTFLDEKILIEKLIAATILDITNLSPKDRTLHKSALRAKKYFLDSIKCETKTDYIFEQLGLFNPKSLNELNKYVEYLFGSKFPKLTKSNADVFADKIILEFVKKVGLKSAKPTLKKLLITLHQEARFPVLPYYFLMLFDKKTELKEHIVFPLWYTFSPDTKYEYKKNKFESAVLHALYTIRPIWEVSDYKCKDWYTKENTIKSPNRHQGFENYLNDLFSLFASMSKPIIDKEYYAEEAKKNINIVKRQATKAAISQVMARNMSHNIGSHVLSRMIRWDDVLTKKQPYKSSLSKLWSFDPEKKEDYQIKFVQEQIIYFNSYLKTRMDFLADIATSTPTIQNTKQFKTELLKGFDDNRLLLNKISGITNFNFTIKVFKDNTELKEGDFPVSISNDVLGFHAFYIILENIIRNTAKHTYSKETKITDVVFKIDVQDINDADKSFYEITISDDCSQTGSVDIDKDELKKYKSILTNNTRKASRIEKLVFDQNDRLNRSILDDETNLLRQGAWGLIEMDVSAAYLRKIAQENVDDDKYQIPLTKVEKIDFLKDSKKEKFRIIEATEVDGKYLGYRFYIPKPKELLIIDGKGDTWDMLFSENPNALNEWKNEGILFLKGNNNTQDKWSFKSEISYPHELVLYLDAKSAKPTSMISKRIVTIKELEICFANYQKKRSPITGEKNLSELWNISKEQLIAEVWRAWVYKGLENKKLKFSEEDITYYDFLPDATNSNNSYEIILDPHGEHYEGKTNGEYREVFPKSQFEHLEKIISKVKPNLKEQIEKLKFIDSSMTNILVLDERIQELMLKEKYYPENNTKVFGGFLFKELWDNVNVYIPEKDKTEINLSEKNYANDYLKKIHSVISDKFFSGNRVKNPIDNSGADVRKCKGIDFIVIHLGVIEKILKGKGNDKKGATEIGQFVKELTNPYKGITVIITSGRGKPDNLPPDIPYLGYSIISQYLIENRFKSLFTQTLYSARPQNR